MVTTEKFLTVIEELKQRGFEDEINWQRNVSFCPDAETFAIEAAWVIMNSGMKSQVVRLIWERALEHGKNEPSRLMAIRNHLHYVFKHEGKIKAIHRLIDNRTDYFTGWLNHKGNMRETYESDLQPKITYLRTLPFIGPVIVYHLAKNLGLDVVKPDRHLVRLATAEDTTPYAMCKRLADATGEKVSTVDIILWRACNLGLL